MIHDFVCGQFTWKFGQFPWEVFSGSIKQKPCCYGYLQFEVPCTLIRAVAELLRNNCQPIWNKISFDIINVKVGMNHFAFIIISLFLHTTSDLVLM